MRFRGGWEFTIVLLTLSGCQGFENVDNRYGPRPVPKPGDVVSSAAIQDKVIGGLVLRSGLPAKPQPGSDEWYYVTLAGYNYVDEKCDAYLHDLFIRDREKARAIGLLSATQATTTAILSATNASKAAITVAAEAFGLAGTATAVLADSYLYKVSPSVIFGAVEKTRKAYQDETVAKFRNRVEPVRSEPATYSLVRGYLELCMPENIETAITNAIATAAAKPSDTVQSAEGNGKVGSPKIAVQLVTP